MIVTSRKIEAHNVREIKREIVRRLEAAGLDKAWGWWSESLDEWGRRADHRMWDVHP